MCLLTSSPYLSLVLPGKGRGKKKKILAFTTCVQPLFRGPYLPPQNLIIVLDEWKWEENGERKRIIEFGSHYTTFHTEDRDSGIWIARKVIPLLYIYYCYLIGMTRPFGNYILSSEAELDLCSSSHAQYRENGVNTV